MKNSYFVFGNRYCGWNDIYEWIEDHQNAGFLASSKDTHLANKYDKRIDEDNMYYSFCETPLVYHEDILFSSDLAHYRKTIIIYRDLTDIIADILKYTRVSVDKVINNQIELFEEYTDELVGNTSKIYEPYFLPIFYDTWRTNLNYRNNLADMLGFENKMDDVIERSYNYKDRSKVRYKRQITQRVKDLNSRI